MSSIVRKNTRSTMRNRKQTLSRQQVKDMIRSKIAFVLERKIYSVTTATTASNNTGVVIPITQGLTQGDDFFNRAGDKVTVELIIVRAQFQLNLLATAATIRYILFYDTTNNGALPSVSDVIQNPTVVSPHQPTNLLKKRFHFLADLAIPLVQGGQHQVVHKDLKFNKKFQVFYSGTADLAAANSRNALFCLVICDVGTNQPTYNFTHHLEYFDG